MMRQPRFEEMDAPFGSRKVYWSQLAIFLGAECITLAY